MIEPLPPAFHATRRTLETFARQLAALFALPIVLFVFTSSFVALLLAAPAGWAFFHALNALQESRALIGERALRHALLGLQQREAEEAICRARHRAAFLHHSPAEGRA